jgi:membrane-associated phospholipid phosphatase
MRSFFFIINASLIFAQEESDNTLRRMRFGSLPRIKRSKQLSLATLCKNIGYDLLMLHKNIFHVDTLKIAAAIVPIVLATHQIDDEIHANFYTKESHQNIHQMPKWTRELARFVNTPIISGFGIAGLLSSNDDFRYTTHIMLLSIPILIYMNQLIGKMKFDINLRPWNGEFSRIKRSPGGFPSGHMAKGTYIATLYGMRYGYKFALPLSVATAFIGVTFLASNRHYLSQLVAGVGFGLVYGFAATKLVNNKIIQKTNFSIKSDDYGNPAVAFSYKF